MRMQHELLREKFDDCDTAASATDLIKSMARGGDAHHAGALKFGLREGFSRPLPVEGRVQPGVGAKKPMNHWGSFR